MSDPQWYLKEWRKRAGLTLEGLADKVGTSAGQLSDLEKGKRRFNNDWLEKFAGARLRPESAALAPASREGGQAP
jgi:transcriptional regulator with XRE-family HTH domain